MANLSKCHAAGSNLVCAAARLMTPHVIISRPLCIVKSQCGRGRRNIFYILSETQILRIEYFHVFFNLKKNLVEKNF